MEEMKKMLVQLGEGFLSFVIVLVIGVVLVKIILVPIKKVMLKSKIEHTAKTFIFSIIRVVFYGMAVLTALGSARVDITSLITALGAAGVTLGLAFQDTLKNLVSGMIILFSKPFKAGDLIEFENYEGYIDSIRIFYTTMHTFDNRYVQIPNSKLTNGNVTNCSSGVTRRVDIAFTVSYEDSIAKVKSVIFDEISKNPLILPDPEPKVFVSNHLDSGIEIKVWIWTNHTDYYTVLFDMKEKVKLAFDENGITIPYPHIEIVGNKSE